MGRGGLSLPSRGHKKNQKQTEQQPTIEADGLTVSNDGKKLLVATEDGRILSMTIAPATKWVRSANNITASQIVPRTKVHVVAAEDDEAFLTTVSVDLLKEAPTEEPAETAAASRVGGNPRAKAGGNAGDGTPPDDEEMARPTILKSPAAPGRPVLKRGVPKDGELPDCGFVGIVSRNNETAAERQGRLRCCEGRYGQCDGFYFGRRGSSRETQQRLRPAD